MTDIKIKIKPHLAQYLHGKYYDHKQKMVVLPKTSDIYHALWQLLAKLPKNAHPCIHGNITIALPKRRVGKSPLVYNWLSCKSIKILEKKIEREFNTEVRQEMEDWKKQDGTPFLETAYMFKEKYGIEDISEDALIKQYYRYRNKLRQQVYRRKYKKK